mmetsp:Transcript_82867/g.221429  ORF Transcript_82867/g.221429 Transcript_82867/m.221429 type:complete len:366 (+) Transcript_82867:229-1326(+)
MSSKTVWTAFPDSFSKIAGFSDSLTTDGGKTVTACPNHDGNSAGNARWMYSKVCGISSAMNLGGTARITAKFADITWGAAFLSSAKICGGACCGSPEPNAYMLSRKAYTDSAVGLRSMRMQTQARLITRSRIALADTISGEKRNDRSKMPKKSSTSSTLSCKACWSAVRLASPMSVILWNNSKMNGLISASRWYALIRISTAYRYEECWCAVNLWRIFWHQSDTSCLQNSGTHRIECFITRQQPSTTVGSPGCVSSPLSTLCQMAFFTSCSATTASLGSPFRSFTFRITACTRSRIWAKTSAFSRCSWRPPISGAITCSIALVQSASSVSDVITTETASTTFRWHLGSKMGMEATYNVTRSCHKA